MQAECSFSDTESLDQYMDLFEDVALVAQTDDDAQRVSVAPRVTPVSCFFLTNLTFAEDRISSAADTVAPKTLYAFKNLLLPLVDAGSLFVTNALEQREWKRRIRESPTKQCLLQVIAAIRTYYGMS